jgi:hypothetical protein
MVRGGGHFERSSSVKYMAIAASVVVVGMIAGAAAFAEQSDGPGRHRHEHGTGDFAAMHTTMCQDHYAHEAGRAAYLEARLSLNDSQEKLFDNWKSVVLNDAEAHAKSCAAFTPPSSPPDLLSRMAHEQEMLKSKLASLEAEMPALTALYQSLSAEQKEAFDHGEMHGEHGGWMGHEHGDHDGDHEHGEHHGDDDGHGA